MRPLVIVVGDDLDARSTVASALAPEDFDVVEASWAGAINAIDWRHRPVAVLFDVDGPGQDDETIRFLENSWLGIPLVSISSSSTGAEGSRPRLAKPVDSKVLRALLGKLCCSSTGDSFVYGVDRMDIEHRLQVRLVDAFVQELAHRRDVESESLSDLAQTAKGHFDYESELMNRYAFGDTEKHQREHSEWLRSLEDIKRGRCSLGAGLALRGSMLDHIQTMDQDFARVLALTRGRV